MKRLTLLAAALLTAAMVLGPPDRARAEITDEVFWRTVERLMDRFGDHPGQWPPGRDKTRVRDYLRDYHNVELDQAVLAKNFLGLGVGNSPDQARSTTELDGWGRRYDLVMASSMGAGKLDKVFGFAINQGMALFNPQLADHPYLFLKADLHSQFCDVFKNFNGVSIKILAREVNFLGCPGSAGRDYPRDVRPALTAADALQAAIYTCDQDMITQIVAEDLHNMVESFGVDMPFQPAPKRKAMGRLKPVEIKRIDLNNCGHEIGNYTRGMKRRGETLLD